MTQENLSKGTINAVVLMRILIGWHFLYEGVLKMYTSGWTAKAYLMSAEIFPGFFQWLASDGMIGIVDYLNIFALMIVGLTLVLGYFERIGALIGMVLLIMYYLAHPALPGSPEIGTEGSYWLVNKNLIEAAALYVLYQIPSGSAFGILRLRKSSSTQPITQ